MYSPCKELGEAVDRHGAKHMFTEDYFINDARNLVRVSVLAAKAAIVTAQCVFPDSFQVAFERYLLEKQDRQVKIAANCFSDLLWKFGNEPKFRIEIDKIMKIIQGLHLNEFENEVKFYAEMFSLLTESIQNKLLYICVDTCNDPMERCKMLLMLLRKFPENIPKHCEKLISSLFGHENGSLRNDPYRKLFVCELVPLLLEHKDLKLNLNYSILLASLNKCMMYHLWTVNYKDLDRVAPVVSDENVEAEERDKKWKHIFLIFEYFASKMQWSSKLFSFADLSNMNVTLKKFHQYMETNNFFAISKQPNSALLQFTYSLVLLLFYSLEKYYSTFNVTCDGIVFKLFLTKSKIDAKKAENSSESSTNLVFSHLDPFITSKLQKSFQCFINCSNLWSLICFSETIVKEFQEIVSEIKVESVLAQFKIDQMFYTVQYSSVIKSTNKLESLGNDRLTLPDLLRLLTIQALDKTAAGTKSIIDIVIDILKVMPDHKIALDYDTFLVSEYEDNWLLLPIASNTVLQYCVRILINLLNHCLIECAMNEDLIIGHLLVLTQLDTNHNEDLTMKLFERIARRKRLRYRPLFSYIVRIEYLEEIMFLTSEHGGGVFFEFQQFSNEALDEVQKIQQASVQQKRSLRINFLRDKIRAFVDKQLNRNNESIDDLIIQFLHNEKESMRNCLETASDSQLMDIL